MDKSSVDTFTVSLHSPNGRHWPALRTVQGHYQWPLEKSMNSHLPGSPNKENTMLMGIPPAEIKPANHESVDASQVGPCLQTFSPTATNLGLCNSLKNREAQITLNDGSHRVCYPAKLNKTHTAKGWSRYHNQTMRVCMQFRADHPRFPR